MTDANCVPYHNCITGPSREVDVVRVGRDSTISLFNVACHILTYTLDALAGTVRPLNARECTLIQTTTALFVS